MAKTSGIEISILNRTPHKPIPRSHLRNVVERVLSGEGVSDATVSLVLLTDAEIHEVNKEFLDHDYPTDVITFSLEEESIDGEICIGLETAQRQAQEYGVSLRNELMRLAAHGTLHLVGYDDATDEQRAEMSRLEDRYMS